MPQLQLTDILQFQQFQGLTDQQALDLGNQQSLYNPNMPAYTYSGLGIILAGANVDQSILFDIPAFVKSLIGGASLDAFLISGGCAFGDAQIIQQLEANAAAQSGNAINLAAINAMLDMKGSFGSLWDQHGCPAPSLPNITAARAQIAAQAWWSNVQNVVVPPLISAGDISAIKTAIAGA